VLMVGTVRITDCGDTATEFPPRAELMDALAEVARSDRVTWAWHQQVRGINALWWAARSTVVRVSSWEVTMRK